MKSILSLKYIIALLLLMLIPPAINGKTSEKKPFTLVIDAGHGGKDLGATDNNAREKDINLGVALHLQSLIKKGMKDSRVVMTRENDKYLTLQERADEANKSKGDLFISIHTNSVDKANRNRINIAGSSVYALGLHKDDNNMKVAQRENSVIELESNFEQKYSGFDPAKDESYIIFEMAQKKNLSKSIKFAELAQKQLTKSGRADRGVHQAGFWVLWATSMPSVLVELDFICNPVSAKYLASDKGQKELAEAIYKAVHSYYKDWQKMQKNASMTQSMAVAAESASMEAEREISGNDVSGKENGKRKVLASTRSNIKKESHVAKSDKSNNIKRRRRNDQSKASSSSRNVETEKIPLHSSMDRAGKYVEPEPEKVEKEKEEVDNSSKGKKSKKDKSKKEKNKKDNKKEGKKDIKKESKRPANSHNAKVERFVTVYKIQILTSSDLLKQNNPLFCGLSPVTTYKENNQYKYFYGESENLDEMNRLLKDVKKKIPEAFVVASKKMMSTK